MRGFRGCVIADHLPLDFALPRILIWVVCGLSGGHFLGIEFMNAMVKSPAAHSLSDSHIFYFSHLAEITDCDFPYQLFQTSGQFAARRSHWVPDAMRRVTKAA